MALSIKDPETERLARNLAQLTRGGPLLFKGEDFAKTDVNRPGEAARR